MAQKQAESSRKQLIHLRLNGRWRDDAVAENRPHRLQRAFHEKLGTQCGFCTPGMIMAAEALLRRNSRPSKEEIKAALAGNICRCTGYVKIIESVHAAAEATS